MENSQREILKLQLTQDLVLHYLSTDMCIGQYICRAGSYEPFEMSLLLSLLNEGDIVVDIGANIGVYTLNMAQKVGAMGKVYAFEPEPTNFELLTKNVEENELTNVVCSDVALSNRAAPASLFISKQNFGDHRLYQEDNTERKSVPVMTDTLDNLLREIYREKGVVKVIKIDTQGFEPFVIEGAKQIIQENHPAIFLEYWPAGFKNAGADYYAMMDFLVDVYGKLYLIDEYRKKIFSTNQDFIDGGCYASQYFMERYFGAIDGAHCNIAFFGRDAILSFKKLANHVLRAK